MLASPHSTPFTLLYPHPSVPSPRSPSFTLRHHPSSYFTHHTSTLTLYHPTSPSFTLLLHPSSYFTHHPSTLTLCHTTSPYVTLLHPPSPSFFILNQRSPLTPHPSLLTSFAHSLNIHHPFSPFTLLHPSLFTTIHPSPIFPTYRTLIHFVGSLLEQSHHSLLTSFAHSLNQTVLGFHSHSILLKRLLVSVDQFSAAGVANP